MQSWLRNDLRSSLDLEKTGDFRHFKSTEDWEVGWQKNIQYNILDAARHVRREITRLNTSRSSLDVVEEASR